MKAKHRVGHHEEGLRARSGHRGESTLELVGASGLQELRLQCQQEAARKLGSADVPATTGITGTIGRSEVKSLR